MSKMKEYLDSLLYCDCLILPFDNIEGKITAIHYNKNGVLYQVRYFMNGDYRIDDFFDFDIEIIEGTNG